jgi:hypothetical protein
MTTPDMITFDPSWTRRETRQFLLVELDTWFTGDLVEQAVALDKMDMTTEYMEGEVAKGIWPVGRLVLIKRDMEREHLLYTSENTNEVYSCVAWFCLEYVWSLLGQTCSRLEWTKGCSQEIFKTMIQKEEMRKRIQGFLTVDTMEDGRTLYEVWNGTPFQSLRSALPLSTCEHPLYSADIGVDEEEEEEEETEGENSVS